MEPIYEKFNIWLNNDYLQYEEIFKFMAIFTQIVLSNFVTRRLILFTAFLFDIDNV